MLYPILLMRACASAAARFCASSAVVMRLCCFMRVRVSARVSAARFCASSAAAVEPSSSRRSAEARSRNARRNAQQKKRSRNARTRTYF